jgi:hypothetical protein
MMQYRKNNNIPDCKTRHAWRVNIFSSQIVRPAMPGGSIKSLFHPLPEISFRLSALAPFDRRSLGEGGLRPCTIMPLCCSSVSHEHNLYYL